MEYRFRKADGTSTTVHDRGYVIRDEDGQLAGYVYVDTVSNDIGGYVERARQVRQTELQALMATAVRLREDYGANDLRRLACKAHNGAQARRLMALAAIAAIGIRGLRDHTGYGLPTSQHDFDTPEDRHRFLGFASLLLAGLSAVATILVALGAVFFETCR